MKRELKIVVIRTIGVIPAYFFVDFDRFKHPWMMVGLFGAALGWCVAFMIIADDFWKRHNDNRP